MIYIVVKFGNYLNRSFYLKESKSISSDWELSYSNKEPKPIGQPVGGAKNPNYEDPDWIPLNKENETYTCAKCEYPLVGYGKNIPSSGFVVSRQTNIIPCPNCGTVNDVGWFSGYIKMDGKIDKTYFNRTTPVQDTIGDIMGDKLVKTRWK